MKKGGVKMCMNNSMHHSECGCGCGCSSNCNKCKTLGPFVAIDNACVIPAPASGSGAMLFSANGADVVLDPATTTGSIIGLGLTSNGVSTAGNQITLAPGDSNLAYTIPRNGSITSMAAHFVLTAPLTVPAGTVVTIQAQIYKATGVSNVFNATNAFVNLTSISTSAAAGFTISGTANNFPLVPVGIGDRLLVVFTATQTGPALGTTITGDATAGVTII